MKKLIKKFITYFTMNEYYTCPKCGDEAYWEGYCNSCGYSNEEGGFGG